MKTKTKNWKIIDLVRLEDKINPKPQYQRSPVWNDVKKKLLIDSILRGYDIPKFYVRQSPPHSGYDYEVVDGQQRMRSIWEFVKDEIPLNRSVIGTTDLTNKKYSELHSVYKKKFDDFKISVTFIEKATQAEIRSLFARLQMGVSLNPAELRHALASNIGNTIQMTIETHTFFQKNCKIKDNRYKHQDYLDHVITLIFYDDKYDLKAPFLKKLYEDHATSKIDEFSPKFIIVNQILDWMFEINKYSNGIFKNKWGFVDMFYLMYKNYKQIKSINYRELAKSLSDFEKIRKMYNKEPENLIEDKTKLTYDKNLYDYIIAFKTQGGMRNNIKIRNRVYNQKFFTKTNFKI